MVVQDPSEPPPGLTALWEVESATTSQRAPEQAQRAVSGTDASAPTEPWQEG